MSGTLSLAALEHARSLHDPQLAARVIALAAASDPSPDSPIREGALTIDAYRRSLWRYKYRTQPPAERAAYRTAQWALLEADDAEVSLPDRYRLDTLILDLWADESAYARDQLLRIIARIKLRWGPWRALKRIFKEAEERDDLEVFGALAARFDMALASRSHDREISRATLAYMVRRAWRYLRRLGEQFPVAYPDAAVEVLRHYGEDTNWRNTWIANHIFYHEQGKYSRRRFHGHRPGTLLKYRAFSDLWGRSPRPLFTLLEQAQSGQAARFAVDALKRDFRTALRSVEPAWVVRLIAARKDTVDGFVVWLLENVPRFEQGAFVEMGLHDAVLTLLDSPSDGARKYAASYLRTHARDATVDALIRWANNDHADVRAAAQAIISDRDPRKDVGLDNWALLLKTSHAHDWAAKVLATHFGPRELTVDWFRGLLLDANRSLVNFARGNLSRVHPKLGYEFYVTLLEDPEVTRAAAIFAIKQLDSSRKAKLEPELVRLALLNPHTQGTVRTWIIEERIPPADLDASFWQALADERTWEKNEWIKALLASERRWAKDLSFSHQLQSLALGVLADVRKFTADQLGFEWLLGLVRRSDAELHKFASDYMTKAFLPADFAEKGDAPAEAKSDAPIEADLEGASFLFTGKLMTMTRSVAQKMVAAANGAKASGVNKKLDYLVIGDEGSSLYGEGRKGSKQIKAEKLIAGGAPLRIISETAFLKMLAGESSTADEGDTEAGSERLWQMATGADAPDSPEARFATHYIRMHHTKICVIETDRYVDPGAEFDPFLTFDRVRLLLADSRAALRKLGLEFCHYEFAGWAPPMQALVELCELPYPEVRDFVTKALTADESAEHDTYRLDPAMLTADAVYRFCDSLDPATRALGMTLIAAHPKLALPTELFRLTESPDRGMRAFVIRQLWTLYRDRGVTKSWAPKDAGDEQRARPEEPPASADDLRGFLRRSLFGIPPARPPKKKHGTLRPLSARRAKLALIEIVRDLALEDAGFAEHALPLLTLFIGSRGQSESAACLVAVTRIHQAHDLGGA